MAAVPQVALHHAQTVRVMCTEKHILTGLFVIFKLAPLPEGAQKLHDHVTGTEKTKPAAPTPPKRPEEPQAPTKVEKAVQPKKPKAAASELEQAAYKQQTDDYEVAKAAYDGYVKLKAQYDKDHKAYRGKLNDYNVQFEKYKLDLAEYENWTHLDPPDPADNFVLGFVDHLGFLQPVHDDSNPWFEMGTLEIKEEKLVEVNRRNPHTYKLTVGERFKVCAVRHPSPDLARALTAYLNSNGSKDDDAYNFSYVDGEAMSWEAYLRDVTIEKEGDQPVMKLSEDAADYFPQGSSRYGNWMLYREMPHGKCATVPDQVKKLMIDLGKMRYPCGREDKPYRQRKRAFNGPWEKAPDDLVFDGQVQACVARLQEHVREAETDDAGSSGYAFEVAKEAHEKGEWSYLIGSSIVDRNTVLPRDGEDKLRPLSPLRTKGVVDVETGWVIDHWLMRRLRKPGHILLPTSTISAGKLVEYYTYLLQDGALSVDVWDGLARVFGCDYGTQGGSSVRSVNAGVWPGAINNSVHKTGLAIDMAGGATRHSTMAWPIRYEAHWEASDAAIAKISGDRNAELQKLVHKQELDQKLAAGKKLTTKEQKDLTELGTLDARRAALQKAQDELYAKIKADDADGKFYWIQRWRVYGHSKLDVFGGLEESVKTLKNELAAFLGVVAPTPEPPSPTAVRGGLWKRIKDAHFAAVSEEVCGHWIDLAVAPFVNRLSALLSLDALALRDKFFRRAVVQFTPNAYEGDGGTSGKIYGPTDSDGDFPGAPFSAKSWVNLSSLAQHAGMLRIGPHSRDYRDQTFVLGPDNPKAAPKLFPFAPYFTNANADAGDVATMLKDISASEAEAPQLKQREFVIVVIRDDAKVIELKPAAVDGSFVKDWADKMRRPIQEKSSPVTSPGGAAVSFVFSASDESVSKLRSAADKIGEFGEKYFLVTHIGTQAGLEIGTDRVLKGSDLKTKLKDAIEGFLGKKATAEKNARDKLEADQRNAEKRVRDEEEERVALGKKASKPSDLEKQIKKKKEEIATKAKKATTEAAAAAAKKEVTDWKIELTPIFLKESDLPKDVAGKVVVAKIPFLPKDEVKLPVHSDAGHLEWWHFQHVSAKEEWGTLLERIGYSREVMGTPKAGVNDVADPVHRGLGYSKKDLESHPGAVANTPVENLDAYTPLGG